MKLVLVMGLVCAFSPQAQAQDRFQQACARPVTRDAGANRIFLADRAADIIARARASGWREDRALRSLIDPGASFSLMFGDSGSRFDAGLEGARALAGKIRAGTYRYSKHAGYAEGPFSPCADQSVTVEFSDGKSHTRIDVTFTFRDDVLISATGLGSDFGEGLLKPAD